MKEHPCVWFELLHRQLVSPAAHNSHGLLLLGYRGENELVVDQTGLQQPPENGRMSRLVFMTS